MGIATAFRALPSKFNIVRVCIYTVVILWSIICLGIAAHLASVLTSSELTRFVPFAIFVSVASILVMFCLIAFGVWSNMNPITVRIELACLGLVGTLWLALGAFLASSESQDADVECFAAGADDNSMPTDEGGFTTETFQAEYRVLLAFSLFNLILVASFLALLLLLAIRRYTAGDRTVWHDPVPSVAWFGPIKATKSTSHSRGHQQQRSLPTPVTEKPNRPRTHSRSLSIAALFTSREGGGSGNAGTRGDAIAKPSYTKPVDEHYVWVPEQPRPGERARVDRDNTRTTAGTRGDRAPATTNTRVERATAGTRGQVGARGERERERTTRAGAAATPLTAAQLERDNTRSTGTTRLERDNTRSTAHSRTPLVEPPSRNNTRSTTASASRREPDRFTAPPERTSSRRNRERERERESSRDRDYDAPSRNNTRSTQATRTTTDSRRDRDRDRGRGREERASERAVVVPAPAPVARQTSGSGRKPDYYRRDLSPRR